MSYDMNPVYWLQANFLNIYVLTFLRLNQLNALLTGAEHYRFKHPALKPKLFFLYGTHHFPFNLRDSAEVDILLVPEVSIKSYLVCPMHILYENPFIISPILVYGGLG